MKHYQILHQTIFFMENAHLIQRILDLLTLLIFTVSSLVIKLIATYVIATSLFPFTQTVLVQILCASRSSPLYSAQELPSTAKSKPTMIFFQLSQTITWNKSADTGSLCLEASFLLCISEIMTNAGYK